MLAFVVKAAFLPAFLPPAPLSSLSVSTPALSTRPFPPPRPLSARTRSRRPPLTMLSADSLASAASSAVASSTTALSRADLPRLAVWASLCAFAFLLRSFFPVILGTFIVGYVANSIVVRGVRMSNNRLPRRGLVVLFYAAVLTAIASFSLVTVPTVVREGQYFVRTLQSENPYVITANVMRRTLGDDLVLKLETFVVYATDAPSFDSRSPAARRAAAAASLPAASVRNERFRGRSSEKGDDVWSPERSRRLGMLLQKSIRGYVAGTAGFLSRLLQTSTKVVVKALLSLVFSFMIMWDLPVIMTGMRKLGDKRSRVKFAYDELAPFFADFGSVLGKAFEAQGLIAVVNTSLTTLGLTLLGVPGVGFLSVVTLVCSFIPVAGVFVSTLPMLVLALSEFGAAKAGAVLLMVIGVHLVEAYVLNPQIYSAHLHLHPFLVLVVLYVAEHLYGVAGLLMAVPVSVYLLRSLVLGEMRSSVADENLAESDSALAE